VTTRHCTRIRIAVFGLITCALAGLKSSVEYIRQVCAIVPDLFLAPVDWMQRTLERSSLGVNVGFQSFTDLDYADDVALLAELLYILTHGLGS